MSPSTNAVDGNFTIPITASSSHNPIPERHQIASSEPVVAVPSTIQASQMYQLQATQIPVNIISDVNEKKKPLDSAYPSVSSQHISDQPSTLPKVTSVSVGKTKRTAEQFTSSNTTSYNSISVTSSSLAPQEINVVRNTGHASQQIAQRLRQRFSNLANRQRNAIQEQSLQTGKPPLQMRPPVDLKQPLTRASKFKLCYIS